MNSSKPSIANTLSEIIADINSGIINKIIIDTTGLNKVYTAHTTLDNSDLSVNCNHLWCYMTGKHGFNNMETITHIYHFKTGRFNNIMFIIKIKGKAKIPDFIQLRDDNMILLEYFSAARPLNKLKSYGIKSSDEDILKYVNELEYGKLQKLSLK